jgi:hypothetical protein
MTPTLQASDLDVEGLVRDLPALREEAESFAKAAHAGVTDLAALVSLLLAEVDTATAQLAAEKARADKAELHGAEAHAKATAEATRQFIRAQAAERKLAAAEANLAAANKQIEEMRGAQTPFTLHAKELFARNWNASDIVHELPPRYGFRSSITAGDFFRLHTARTALSHEARNGWDRL